MFDYGLCEAVAGWEGTGWGKSWFLSQAPSMKQEGRGGIWVVANTDDVTV